MTDKVHYGTFSEVSELIINEYGDVRKLVSGLYSSEKNKGTNGKIKKVKQNNRILLVD